MQPKQQNPGGPFCFFRTATIQWHHPTLTENALNAGRNFQELKRQAHIESNFGRGSLFFETPRGILIDFTQYQTDPIQDAEKLLAGILQKHKRGCRHPPGWSYSFAKLTVSAYLCGLTPVKNGRTIDPIYQMLSNSFSMNELEDSGQDRIKY